MQNVDKLPLAEVEMVASQSVLTESLGFLSLNNYSRNESAFRKTTCIQDQCTHRQDS